MSGIDIGYAPDRGEETEELVLRIHVRERWMKASPETRVAFPEQVEGISVAVMPGKPPRFETDAPAASEESNHPNPTPRSTTMGAEEENVAASAHDERDDLATINGIGPKWADAMYRIGIRRLADLAQYTSEELSKALLEQAGVKVPPERIETKNWIGQARELAQLANAERTPSEEGAEEPEETSNRPTRCRDDLTFTVSFDYVTNEHGEQVWQVLVYDERSLGEEKTFKEKQIETYEWAKWILERAKLPVAAEPVRPEIEAAAPPAPVAPYDARIEILDVQVSEIGPSPGVPEKRLMAEVCFQVSGSEADTVTADHIPFRIEVHTVDLESGASNLVASKQSQLQPQVFEYPSQQTFLVPEVGRYELHSIVLLLPPGEMMASHRGPTIRVVP